MSFDFSGSSDKCVYARRSRLPAQRSRQRAFAFSTVVCPRAKNEFCRFRFAQFVNTQLPLKFSGRESFLARGRGQPGERQRREPSAAEGSSAQPGLPRARLLEHVFAVVGVVGRISDKKRFPRFVFKAIFLCVWLSGWLMWIGKYCWPI